MHIELQKYLTARFRQEGLNPAFVDNVTIHFNDRGGYDLDLLDYSLGGENEARVLDELMDDLVIEAVINGTYNRPDWVDELTTGGTRSMSASAPEETMEGTTAAMPNEEFANIGDLHEPVQPTAKVPWYTKLINGIKNLFTKNT
jgi:hypothetical protein